jgi:hypothetical protein
MTFGFVRCEDLRARHHVIDNLEHRPARFRRSLKRR